MTIVENLGHVQENRNTSSCSSWSLAIPYDWGCLGFCIVINNIGKIWNGWEKNYLGFFMEIRKPGFQTLNASPSPTAVPSYEDLTLNVSKHTTQGKLVPQNDDQALVV